LNHRGNEAERAVLYAPAMTQKTYDLLFEHALATLRSGRSVILDATFSKLEHRNAFKELMAVEGCNVRWIEAYASEPVVCECLKERDQDEAVVSDARFEDYKRLSAGYEPPDELPPTEKLSICADDKLDPVFSVLLRQLVVW
jgi:hypothetical protein